MITFDDSIKKVLNITDDLKQKVREELTEMRALKAAARKACQAESDRIFCEKLAKDEAEKRIAAEMAERALKRGEFLKSAGKVGLVVAGIVVVSYGIYKVTPHVKQWWNNQKKPKDIEDED